MIRTCKACGQEFDAQVEYMGEVYRRYCLPCEDHIAEMMTEFDRERDDDDERD